MYIIYIVHFEMNKLLSLNLYIRSLSQSVKSMHWLLYKMFTHFTMAYFWDTIISTSKRCTHCNCCLIVADDIHKTHTNYHNNKISTRDENQNFYSQCCFLLIYCYGRQYLQWGWSRKSVHGGGGCGTQLCQDNEVSNFLWLAPIIYVDVQWQALLYLMNVLASA